MLINDQGLSRRDFLRTAAAVVGLASWMIHCHILEHQHSGMMAVIRVA